MGAAFILLASALSGPAAASGGSCGLLPPSVPALEVPGSLLAVAGSATDAWAVGEQDVGAVKRTVAEHWDGTKWSVIQTPNPGADLNELTAVSGVSSTDVWAAGTWAEGGIERPLVIHWDGVRWSRLPARPPSRADAIATLEGLAALSSTQVLAVGAHGPSDTELQPLLEVSRGCGS